LKPTHFASELYIVLSRKKVVYIVFSAATGFICTECGHENPLDERKKEKKRVES
jgi:hypothetical protein